jgi:hypothetical protein
VPLRQQCRAFATAAPVALSGVCFWASGRFVARGTSIAESPSNAREQGIGITRTTRAVSITSAKGGSFRASFNAFQAFDGAPRSQPVPGCSRSFRCNASPPSWARAVKWQRSRRASTRSSRFRLPATTWPANQSRTREVAFYNRCGESNSRRSL